MIKPDIILCNIIATELELPFERVVVYNQNWKSPQDEGIYVVISEGTSKVIANTNRFDRDTDQEVKRVSISTTYNIEISSRNTDAKYRKFEILGAINSDYSEKKQEMNHMRIFRANQVLDLSFIDGRSSLSRYQIPVIINSVKTYRKSVETFNQFRDVELDIQPDPERLPHSFVEVFTFWRYSEGYLNPLLTAGFTQYADEPFGKFLRY